jgi:hypothetical protein
VLARGQPAAIGEVIDRDVAGYHYDPSRDQVIEWIVTAGLTVVDEAYHHQDGLGYRHLLLQRPTRVGESGRQSSEQGETS